MAKKDYELDGDLVRCWSTFVPDEAIELVTKTLKSQWINTGKMEKLFRKKISEKFNFRHCVACTSGTAALRTAYATLGVGPGDEVVTTPYTFIATNTAILEQGAKPVFADIDYETLNIDPKSVESKVTDKTKAIVCVHYGGLPCDMEELRAVAARHSLPIIEDSAHALGSKYKGKYIGSEGDVITFSMQVVKIVNCGDGGIISTPNEELYQKAKRLVWYGIDREQKKTNILDPLPDDIDMLGFKYNMNDITASLAVAAVDSYDAPATLRKNIGNLYRQEVSKLSKFKLMAHCPDKDPNFQIFPVHVLERLRFAEFMRDRGVMVNVNNRRNDRYSIFGGLQDLPNTAKAEQDVILIPLHADMEDKHISRVLDAMREYDAQ